MFSIYSLLPYVIMVRGDNDDLYQPEHIEKPLWVLA